MAKTDAQVCNVLVRRVVTNDYRSVIDLFKVSTFSNMCKLLKNCNLELLQTKIITFDSTEL